MSAESLQPSTDEETLRDDLILSDKILMGLSELKESEKVSLEDGTSLEIQSEELGSHTLVTVTSLKEVDGAEYIGEIIGTVFLDTDKLEDAVIDLPNDEELGEIIEKLSKKQS